MEFKEEVKKLIPRIINVKTPLVDITTESNQRKKQVGSKLNKKLKNINDNLKNADDVNKKLLELNNKTSNERDIYLLQYYFEMTYRLIFGSQLYILVNLEIQSCMHKKNIEDIYNNTIWILQNYPLNSYIQFLENSFLIEYKTDEETYYITNLGRLFLNYLRTNNIDLINNNINKVPY